MSKLTGVHLVKERRRATIENPAPGASTWIDHVVVYLEVDGVQVKVIDEVDGMFDHFVHPSGIQRAIEGVEL